jgi:hypothetical protein
LVEDQNAPVHRMLPYRANQDIYTAKPGAPPGGGDVGLHSRL